MIEDIRTYGLPPLTLTLIEEPRDCGSGRGDVRTFAPSLVVESAYRSGDVCYIDLRNTSAKGLWPCRAATSTGDT